MPEQGTTSPGRAGSCAVEKPAHWEKRPPPAFGGYTHSGGTRQCSWADGCNSAVVWRRWAQGMDALEPTLRGEVANGGESGSSRQLMLPEIRATAEQLVRRIEERFPGAGLAGVCRDIVRQCGETEVSIRTLCRPNYWLRAAVVGCVVILVALVVGIVLGVAPRPEKPAVGEFLQGLEAGVNDAVFIGVAIWFLTRMEAGWKRRRAMRALHALRSLAHVVDMHQLTKDPERVTGRSRELTQSSP